MARIIRIRKQTKLPQRENDDTQVHYSTSSHLAYVHVHIVSVNECGKKCSLQLFIIQNNVLICDCYNNW